MDLKEHKQRVLELAADRIVELLPELSPRAVGEKYYLSCPSCGKKDSAFYYKNNQVIKCSRLNECRCSISLFDYLQVREGWPADFGSMLRGLASMVGYNLPALNPQDVQIKAAEHARGVACENLFSVFRAHYIFDDEAEPLKKYLSDRGWSAAEIDNIEDVGFFNVGLIEKAVTSGELSGESAAAARDLLNFIGTRRAEYPLIFPWRGVGGHIKSFVFRSIAGDVEPKYLFMSGSKKDEPFNIHAARALRTDEVYLVEGIIDALRMAAGGLKNVVALGGAGLTAGTVEHLKVNKFRHVVLMLDSDKAGLVGTQAAISLLNSKGMSSYFVALPSGIKDPDEFLRNGRTVADLKVLPRESGLRYVTRFAFEAAGPDDIGKKKAAEGALNFLKDMPDDLSFGFEHLTELFSSYGISGTETEKKISEIEAKKNEGAARKKAADALKVALKDIEGGQPQAEVMARVADVQKAVQLENFVNTFKPYTFEMLVDDCVKTPPALELDINKWGVDLHNNIKIQNGSLVIVAGRPRHGKTTFLLNMLTSLCGQYKDKTFVFITYEEQARDIGIKIISILAGPRAELKSKLAIETAFREKANCDALKAGIDKFKKYTASGRLIFDCRVMGITDLCNHINFFKSRYNLGGVFVDYIQKIPNDKGGSSFSRQNEIQFISAQLLETARNCDIPIIVGAQFNRKSDDEKGLKNTQKDAATASAQSPGPRVKLNHLRESGDLEQDANIVLGLYNAAAEGAKTDLIEVDILKNRNGLSSISTQLKWYPAEYFLKASKGKF